MNKWKVAFFACLGLLVSSTLYLGTLVIDSGISYTYQQVSLDDQVKANETLGKLIVAGAKEYTQKDLLHLLRQSDPEAFIVEEENKIIMGNVYFIFENN